MNWSIKRTLLGDRMVTEQDQVVGSTRRGLFSTRVLNASGTLLWCVRTCPLFGGITVNQQKLDVRYKNEADFFLPQSLSGRHPPDIRVPERYRRKFRAEGSA